MKKNNSNKRRKKIRNKTREKKYKIINQMGGSGDGDGAGGGDEEVVVDLSSIDISWDDSRLEHLQRKLSQGISTPIELFKTSYKNNPYFRQLKQLEGGTEIIGGPTTPAEWDAVPLLDCLERAMEGEEQFIAGSRINTRTNMDKRTRYNRFIDTHLRFIVDRALDLRILGNLKDKISKYLSPNEQGGRVLTQEECLCIISNSFLSTWNEEGRTRPHCNYAKMFQSYGVGPHGRVWKELNPEMKVQKCMALMEYFMKRKIEYDSPAGREKLKNTVVKFQLIEVNEEDITGLAATCDYDLLQVNMMPVIPRGTGELKWEEGEEDKYDSRFTSKSKPVPTDKSSARIIDDPEMKSESLNVDFANEAIGGGAMDYGYVQEEELFTLHTDYCCAGLFCRVMKDNQAILLSGGEQIAENRTHNNRELWNIEQYTDTATRIELEGEEPGKLMFPMYTTAIDALDFRVTIKGDPLLELYSTENFFRELTKCYAGLRADDENIRYIRTGNFGGGAFLPPNLFRGDDNARQDYIVFKGLIQLLAASMHDGNDGKQLDYCPFDEGRVSSILLELSKKLRGSGIKAKQLFDILRSKCANYQLLGGYISSRIDGSSDIDIFRGPTLIDETMWANSVKCWITGSDFTMFNRQHHCRHCGRSVSNERSLRTFNLIDKSGTPREGERVCDFCYTLLSGRKPIWQFSGNQRWIDYGDDDDGNDISDQITEFVINNPVGQFPVTIKGSGYYISPYKWRQFRQDNPELWRGVMLKKIKK